MGEKLSPILSATSWERAASLRLPPQPVSPAPVPIPVPPRGNGAGDRRWSRAAASGARGLLAGLPKLL